MGLETSAPANLPFATGINNYYEEAAYDKQGGNDCWRNHENA